MVGQAPFSARPDSLQPGDLLGPFAGTVMDAETLRPIAAATVVGTWAFERGIGLVGPAGTTFPGPRTCPPVAPCACGVSP
jgi:hypothetical protein